MWQGLFRRVRYLLRGEQRDEELQQEMRLHLELRARRNMERGLPPEIAALEARRKFGSPLRAGEISRETWIWRWLEDLGKDLLYAARQLRLSPGFAAASVLTLALGIGANTAVFTLLEAILWRPLPVFEPDRLVRIASVSEGSSRVRGLPSALFEEMLDGGEAFSSVTTAIPDGLAFSIGDRTERVIGDAVTANYFSLLGVQPFLGRFFGPDGDRENWRPEAVLSYDFFVRRFGADPQAIGRTIRLNGYPFTVIGVSPPGFFGLEVGKSWEVRVPLMLPEGMQGRRMPAMLLLDHRRETAVYPIARLEPGVSRERAAAVAEAKLQRLYDAHPEIHERFNRRLHVRLGDARRSVFQEKFERPLWLALAVTGVVLLIACTNLANLLLARAAARRREIAVRLSIGCSRWRLIRQMLAETLLLTALGAGAGLLFAWWGTAALERFMFVPPGNDTTYFDLSPNFAVLGFTIGVCAAVAALCSLAPALASVRTDLNAVLSASNRGTSGNNGAQRLAVAIQVALSLVLLSGALVFLGELGRLGAVDPGFDARRLVMFTTKPVHDGAVRYSEKQLNNLIPELSRRIARLPGVESAASTADGPLSGFTLSTPLRVGSGESVAMEYAADQATPGYIATIGAHLIRGRDFSEADRQGTIPVCIITRSMARALFGDADPVGKTLSSGSIARSRVHEVVGILDDLQYASPKGDMRNLLLTPYFQYNAPTLPTLVVRAATADPSRLMETIRKEIFAFDPNLPVFNTRAGATQQERGLAQERMMSRLTGWFGVLSLVLVATGVYGVIAYAVVRRGREIAIRVAVGAEAGDTVRLVGGEMLRLIGYGIAAGIPAAIAASHWLPGRADLVSYGAPPLVILAIGIGACIVPALRAVRIQPVSALRQD